MSARDADAAPPQLPAGGPRRAADRRDRPDDGSEPVEPSATPDGGTPPGGGAGPAAAWGVLRERVRQPVTIALLCAVLALVMGGAAAAAARGPAGGVSTLVHVATTDDIAPLIRHDDPAFRFVPTAAHYDGAYFYAIARDPLALGRYHAHIDLGAKRYGHAFYGQLAWALSFGQAYRVPWALLLLSLGGLALAAYCASRIAAELGWSPWAGLVVPLSPGLLYATTADTSEAVGAALVAMGLLAWLRGRRGWAAVAFVAMSLTKEPLSLIPLGVLLFEAVRVTRRDGRTVTLRAWRHRRRLLGAAACLAGPVVLFAWLHYVSTRFGRLPLSGNADASTFPLTGLLDTLREAGGYGRGDFGRIQIGAAAIPLVLVLVAAMVIGLVRAVRLRTVVDAAFLVTAPLMFILTPSNVLYPKEYLRLTALAFLLLPGVLAGHRTRARRDTDPSAPATRGRPVRAH